MSPSIGCGVIDVSQTIWSVTPFFYRLNDQEMWGVENFFKAFKYFLLFYFWLIYCETGGTLSEIIWSILLCYS